MTTISPTYRAAVTAVSQDLSMFIVAPLLYAAVVLRLPDLLAETPRTTAEIARLIGNTPDRVQSLLAGLAALDLVERDGAWKYHLTELGAVLCTTHPASLVDDVLFMGQIVYPAFGRFTDALLSDTIPFNAAFGDNFRAYLQTHALTAQTFARSCARDCEQIARHLVADYDFAACRRVVEVCGGLGILSAAITKRHTHVTALVFDHPVMQDGAERYLEQQRVADRCQFQAGDWEDAVPAGDLLVLCSVLHELDDAQCYRLLQRCQQAATHQGHLLMVEMVLDDQLPAQPLAWRDLIALTLTGGRERSLADYRLALSRAGWSITRVFPLTTPTPEEGTPTFYAIEARPIDG
jgi:2-polyprenyl-3-methyl-5-hydroxy-6-metoxy-1,4-benzoquinol methylase